MTHSQSVISSSQLGNERKCSNNQTSIDKKFGGDMVSTRVSKLAVHAERVVTLVKQSQ